MSNLSPEDKQKIKAAYQQFQKELHEIAQQHRTTVTEILAQVDAKQIQVLHDKIKNA